MVMGIQKCSREDDDIKMNEILCYLTNIRKNLSILLIIFLKKTNNFDPS